MKTCLSAPVRRNALVGAALGAAAVIAAPAKADKISHPIAVFEGLDKITGRTITFDVAINETVRFGTLEITPRVCYSRPPTEAPQTDVFAQVDEVDEKGAHKRIFSGWMFADSPGLHGIEHPIYDMWLTDCKGGTVVIHEAPEVDAAAPEENVFPNAATDSNAAPAQDQPPPTPKKRKAKPAPAVVAAPAPVENAPLELTGPGVGGNARGR